MKYLVDTHLLIWAVLNSSKLSDRARAVLGQANGEYCFSAASIWEIALKRTKHPDQFPMSAREARELFLAAGFAELDVSSSHCAAVEGLPPIHGDPFDRVLIAQALSEGMKLVTHDRLVVQYGDMVVAV